MNNHKIKSLLNKILKSQEFAESETYQRLLKYLVKTTQADDIPKESTIAFEVFGKKDFGTSGKDTTVRVYIHNLRQKLDSYYMHEGKNDPILFTIPKGNYRIVFKENRPNSTKVILQKWWIIAGFLAVLFVSFYFILHKPHFSQTHKSSIHQHVLWVDLFENKKPILLVFGDYYLFRDESAPVGFRYIRYFQINSDKDFNKMLPDTADNYITTGHTFIGKFSLWTLNELRNLLPDGSNIELKLASDLNWSDLKKYNIIFVGPLKTLRILKHSLKNLNVSYNVHPNELVFKDQDMDTTFSYHAAKVAETGYERDYTLAAKLPGPNNNVIYIFSSTHDIGHISTVHALTRYSELIKFNDVFQGMKDNCFFLAIFEVQGFERTSFSPSLLYFKPIPPDFDVIQHNVD